MVLRAKRKVKVAGETVTRECEYTISSVGESPESWLARFGRRSDVVACWLNYAIRSAARARASAMLAQLPESVESAQKAYAAMIEMGLGKTREEILAVAQAIPSLAEKLRVEVPLLVTADFANMELPPGFEFDKDANIVQVKRGRKAATAEGDNEDESEDEESSE